MAKTDSSYLTSALSGAVLTFLGASLAFASHPFLIVRESEYDGLRNRATQSPWTEMKASAIQDANQKFYDSSLADYAQKCITLRDVVSSCALAYILDTQNQQAHSAKMAQQLNLGFDDLAATRDSYGSTEWSTNTALGCTLFKAIFGLDIIYNELTLQDRGTIEAKIENLVNVISDWNPSPQAVRALWSLYKGDTSAYDQNRVEYTNIVHQWMTDDGVFHEGNTYARARTAGDWRQQKFLFMDVLEYQGYHDFYSNQKFKNLYEYLYGYAAAPFGRLFSFGDTSPNDKVFGPKNRDPDASTRLFNVSRFGARMGNYAAWHAETNIPKGRLLSYILVDRALSTSPTLAPSRIFYDGGAWLVEREQSKEAMAGGLWNPRKSSWHSHKEVNAIALSAYGEHIIRNAGYLGASTGAMGFSWDYINNTAASGNTVTVDDQDHVLKSGEGILEGLVGANLEYACGDSGNALPNGKHLRNFMFVHPHDGVQGYWLLCDEITAFSVGQQANLNLHPKTDVISTFSQNQDYRCVIGPYVFSANPVYLSIFLATMPQSVVLRDGLLASWDESFVGKYLCANYDTGQNGNCNIVTVIFPYNYYHPQADITRISDATYTGAAIVQNSTIRDVILESSGDATITYDGVSLQGEVAWWRRDNDVLRSFFVKNGNHFNAGATPSLGFESVDNVTIIVEGLAGQITSGGGSVTLYYPGICGIYLDDVLHLDSGQDWVQVSIPAGTHDFTISTQPPADCSQALAMGYGSEYDFNSDCIVNCFDFGQFASDWPHCQTIYESIWTEDFENYLLDDYSWLNDASVPWSRLTATSFIKTADIEGNTGNKYTAVPWYQAWDRRPIDVPLDLSDEIILTAQVAIDGIATHPSWPLSNHVFLSNVGIGIDGDHISFGGLEYGYQAAYTLRDYAEVSTIVGEKWYDVKIVLHQQPGADNDLADLYYKASEDQEWINIVSDFDTHHDVGDSIYIHAYNYTDGTKIGYIDNISLSRSYELCSPSLETLLLFSQQWLNSPLLD